MLDAIPHHNRASFCAIYFAKIMILTRGGDRSGYRKIDFFGVDCGVVGR